MSQRTGWCLVCRHKCHTMTWQMRWHYMFSNKKCNDDLYRMFTSHSSWLKLPTAGTAARHQLLSTLPAAAGLHYGLTEDIIVLGHNGDHIPSAEHNGRYIYIIITIYYSPRQSLGLCISPSIDRCPASSLKVAFP